MEGHRGIWTMGKAVEESRQSRLSRLAHPVLLIDK